MASTAKDFDEVFEEELHEIRQRREVCRAQAANAKDQESYDNETSPSDEEIEARLREELAGVALSGGGVRSAAFNLGLLQALYQSGRMKDVDYLSTVSGGGYAGAMFSASVANDNDGVNWGRGSRFNRLPIEPRPDGSQPSRVYELALHGRMMSRPIQWLSRHLWGWILTISFVISGVIAIASILAWLMRIVWSQENLLTVQSQGFATDLHIAFYPAFLALVIWAFCNVASVMMRAVNVRIPPISRFAYVLLIVTIVLGVVSFSAIGDFDMSDYVSAQIVPADLSATVNSFLDNFGKIALGLLSLCLLPLLTPHKLMESGRNREKPLFRLAFNTAGFAIICGVPLAVFYLLSRENVSGYNLGRPNSDMMTQSHLMELENFIPRLAAEKPNRENEVFDRRGQVAHRIYDAVVASGEHEKYSPLRKEIVDDQMNVSMPTRLLQYVAYQLGLHSGFGDLVENRRKATRSKAKVATFISTDVLTNAALLDGMPNQLNLGAEVGELKSTAKTDPNQVARETVDEGSLLASTASAVALVLSTGGRALDVASAPVEFASFKPIGDKSVIANPHTASANTPSSQSNSGLTDVANSGQSIPESERVLDGLHLTKQVSDASREELKKMIEEIRVRRKVLTNDYAALSNSGSIRWWEPLMYLELLKLYPGNERITAKTLENLAKQEHENDEVWTKRQSEFVALASKEFPELTQGKLNNRSILRIILIASVFDDLGQRRQTENPGLADSANKKKLNKVDSQVLVARRLTLLQHLLRMDSVSLIEKLDEKLTLSLGENYQEDLQFQENFARFHEAEREDLELQLQPIRTGNWALLSAMYPEYIKPRDTVYAWNVNAADQAFRLRIAGYSTLVFLIVGLFANLNIMGLHGVYRDQLAAVWLPTGPFMLKDLDTCRNGGPLHLFNATLNRHGKKLDPDAEGMSRFVLSNRFCGSKRFGYRETWEYENGEMGLADAVAISGAAVSTSYTGDLLFRTLLFLTNFRLGQWVRNPKHFHEEHYWPSPLRILVSYLWHPTDRAYVDLTDGGHLDNTGLSSLLERRCRVMIVGDCSADENSRFESLFTVLQAARAKYGIQINEFHENESESNSKAPSETRSIDAIGRLIPDKLKHFESQSHFAIFQLRYPEKLSEVRSRSGGTCTDPFRSAVLIVVKPTLTGDEPADLLARRRLNDGFPNDSTVNQFLDPEQFESYVMLGRHIGEQLDQFIVAGKLDQYHLPSPWCSLEKNAENTGHPPVPSQSPKTEQDQELPVSVAAGTADTDAMSSELPGPSAVAQLLNPLRFDKAGIGVAIALVRQWAEAEYENDQELLSAGRDVFDHIIRPVSKWAYEEGEQRPLALRRLFCKQLAEILNEHTWIATEADEEIRNDFRNMLEGLGEGVASARRAAASLAPKSEYKEGN